MSEIYAQKKYSTLGQISLHILSIFKIQIKYKLILKLDLESFLEKQLTCTIIHVNNSISFHSAR